ncbi:MAG: M4 family metallopeptidase [Lachnospiraceae bacterium]|nr:M4 family metallopeptidase [Lachnospiraceae bacterium]
MKQQKMNRVIAAFMVPMLCSGLLTGCAFGSSYESVYLLEEDLKASDVALEYYEDVDQVNEDDIREYTTDSDALVVYRDDGYASSLVGRFYDEQVETSDDVLKALAGVYDLLGLNENTEYYLSSTITDTQTNYSYFTYNQMAGDESVKNGSLVVVRDDEHYVCALSNSFSSQVVSTASESITKEQAELVVKGMYPNLSIYSDYTSDVYFNYDNALTKAIVVYTDNPNMTSSFDMPYWEHYISCDGSYLLGSATSNMDAENTSVYHNENYFEGKTEMTYSASLLRGDGTYEDVTVPICYSEEDGLYYMMDSERKIAAADFYDFYAYDQVSFITSTNNEDWDPNYILAYAKYIEVWDFYNMIGVPSIDRAGLPILIGMGMCDEEGNPVDNAGYYGNYNGWGFFGVSDINTDSQALDVVAHEFTHGYTSHAMQGCIYANEQGAINESLSDIMGNLMEMYVGKTTDTTWQIGETGGNVFRLMSDPIQYHQPAYVGDAFYMPPTDNPDAYLNDYGGVHSNSSLLNKVAYDLYAAGMSLDDEIIVWLDAIEFLTPQSDFDDVYVALMLACHSRDGFSEYADVISQSYSDMGMNGNRTENAATASLRNGFFEINVTSSNEAISVLLYDSNGEFYAAYTPDAEGNICIRAEAGTYYLAYQEVSFGSYWGYYYNGSGWSETSQDAATITFQANQVYETIQL